MTESRKSGGQRVEQLVRTGLALAVVTTFAACANKVPVGATAGDIPAGGDGRAIASTTPSGGSRAAAATAGSTTDAGRAAAGAEGGGDSSGARGGASTTAEGAGGAGTTGAGGAVAGAAGTDSSSGGNAAGAATAGAAAETGGGAGGGGAGSTAGVAGTAGGAGGGGAGSTAGAAGTEGTAGDGGTGSTAGAGGATVGGAAGADADTGGAGVTAAAAGVTAGAAGGEGQPYDPVQEAIARAERSRLDDTQAREAELARLQAERDAAAAAAERERRGRVETAANSVKIGEDERLQTLDGALPAVLSVDEKGHFAFDRYDLSPAVRSQLDTIAERLKDAPYDKLYIVGYTDRIGTDEYNQRLSEKRAWSVAGYLMDRGVPPYKLKVEGRGEAGAITTADQCKGLRREALIECLQRDRRVEVVATVKEYNIKVQ